MWLTENGGGADRIPQTGGGYVFRMVCGRLIVAYFQRFPDIFA
ncbi:hypothetical protein [Neisseria weaveri]|nr:hypothetical protein [Neisseria weaveri]